MKRAANRVSKQSVQRTENERNASTVSKSEDAVTATRRPEPRLYAEHEFASAEDFLAGLSPATGRLCAQHAHQQHRWLYRGQGDARWPLQPKAFREDALAANTSNMTEYPFTSAEDHARTELDGVLNFAVLADRAGFPLPHDVPQVRDSRLGPSFKIDLLMYPPTEYLAFTALAQHYGLPTRLLDWTLRPYVATYFAAWDCINNRTDDRTHLAVWAISMGFINAVGPMQDPGFHFISAPTATNPNLHAQAGMFTLVQPRSKETAKGPLRNLDELLHELDRKNIDPPIVRDPSARKGAPTVWRRQWGPVFVKFTLPVREVRVLVRLLNDLGVSAATIYPGLAGVARSILERRNYQWADAESRSR